MMPQGWHTVKRLPLGWTLSAADAALLVRTDERPFALIGRWAGGGAVIGSCPVRVLDAGADPFEALDEQPLVIDETPPIRDEPPPAAGERTRGLGTGESDVVGGGWFGYLGYGLGRRLEAVGGSPPQRGGLADFELAFYDHVLRLDRHGRWWFEALWSDAAAERLTARSAELGHRARRSQRARPFSTQPWRATPEAAGHRLAVAACRDRIHEGDLFQANLCIRLDSTITGDPLDLFLRALGALSPDRAAFFSGPWGAVASLSPELFLERRADRARSAPIKGTRFMPSDPAAAARQREALRTSGKDLAENVMIVDLVRNDLGRVCRSGSISLDVLADPRAHTGVWHLVSEVSGTLRPGTGNAELVRAAFPPGSVTGAPKVAALRVISDLESTAREVYTGAIGFASPVAGLELNVAIRTFEFRGERAWLGVGGGIVADSDPAAEAAECVTKAAPLLRAIGAELVRGEDHRHRAPLVRRGPQPVPRPDPAAGVFETMLVIDGQIVALPEHLARLGRSVSDLYGQALPSSLSEDLTMRAAGARQARLRVNARPVGDRILIDFERSAVRSSQGPACLSPVTVPGGIGGHKWIDRRLVDALPAANPSRDAPGHPWPASISQPLLCDIDGSVLETPRANVFAVTRHGMLVTPPADGRILPGVTRAQVLDRARGLGIETQIRALHLDELAEAPEVFLTGSLAGITPARVGEALTNASGSADAVTSQLRTNLYKTLPQVILR